VSPAPLDLGLLAYTVEATAPALELLDPAKYTNETEQALAKGAWERLKEGSREQLAQTALANAKAAKERDDAKAAGEALMAFASGGPLADTEVAKNEAAEIATLKDGRRRPSQRQRPRRRRPAQSRRPKRRRRKPSPN
jgi:hypothetical protein